MAGKNRSQSLFSKEKLLASRQFQGRKDIMNALLLPKEQYTMEQAQKMMENYMKGKVR
ncbi:MAG: hypothetical protein HFH41_10230 [Lachnospiraceae bacterium]|nr:hypothetical protein [Lachnospiraceae bacterium]